MLPVDIEEGRADMKLNRKQQIYIAILALGLIALLLDKTFLSPQEAEGDAQQVRHIAPEVAATAQGMHDAITDIEPATPTPSYSTVGMRLARFVEEGKVDPLKMRDAFQPSPAWISDFESRGSLDSPSSKAEKFILKYRLIGVYSSRGSRYAIIEGDQDNDGDKENFILAIDQDIDGFKLISVDDRLVVLQNHALTVVLELEE